MPKRSGANITDRAAQAAGAGCIWDREVPGFGLRVLASGARTWVFKYRAPDGRQRWTRIGTCPAMPVRTARIEARRMRAAVDLGHDPTQNRAAERLVALAPTLGSLAAAYARALPGRPSLRGPGAISARHAESEAAAVRRAIERMGLERRTAREVAASDLLGLVRQEAARPATARMLFGAFGRFMDWCMEEGHATSNPCVAVPRHRRPRQPRPRQRVVSLVDLARLWVGAGTLPEPLCDLARLLIAVPVRRGEASRLAWEDIDLREGVWTIPGAITKNGDPHRIAFPAVVLRMLKRRHRAIGEPTAGLAFPAPRSAGVVTTFSAMKRHVSAASGLSAWTWHDFRRSFASLMAESGIAEPVADAVLNHRQSGTRGGVLGVYQLARRWPEQRAALEKWGTALERAIASEERRRKSKTPTHFAALTSPSLPSAEQSSGQPATRPAAIRPTKQRRGTPSGQRR